MNTIEHLEAELTALNTKINIIRENLPTTQGQALWVRACTFLGKDASPADLAPDELGCAETVSDIAQIAPAILSTAQLFTYLSQNASWLNVKFPLPGDIIISPTGMGGKNGIANGHTGIMYDVTHIMSNDSATGNFLENYTVTTWNNRWVNTGGYPVFFFRKIA